MAIYTKTGDEGSTSLYGGKRVKKYDPQIEAVGTIDELNAAIGLALIHTKTAESIFLSSIQEDLFDIGAIIATAPGAKSPIDPAFIKERTQEMEKNIDTMDARLQPLNTFILPAGSDAAAHLHYARTVCRRAERTLVGFGEEEHVNKDLMAYINRLSSYLFVLARFENLHAGRPDIKWEAKRKKVSKEKTLDSF